MEAHETKRALRIAQLDRMMVARPQAVAQNERRHAACIQPIGYLLAFMVHRQHPVTAAGADDNAAMLAVGVWKIDGQVRLVGVFTSESAGRAVGPEQFDFWRRRMLGISERRKKQRRRKSECGSHGFGHKCT